MKTEYFVGSVFGLMLMLTAFGVACSNETAPTVSVAGSEVADTVEPDPTVSSVMEGVEVDRSLPPTVEGVTIVEPLNPTGPTRGGVLAVPMSACPLPDPAIDHASVQFDVDRLSLVTEIHAGLTRIVDDPVAPFEMELSETYDVSDDGMQYEFVLRNDLKFSDGSPLTAGDFKWSWERALKKSDAGSRARDVFGLVEGSDAVILGESEDLAGVAVIDDRTLQVNLTKPRAPEFVELDAMLVDATTERDAVKRHEKYLLIEEYLAEQALVIPIAILDSAMRYRYHPWVHDLDPPKYPGSVFHRVWLDEEAPDRELPLP